MKLVIRESEPKEDEVEIELWLEPNPDGSVKVMSKKSDRKLTFLYEAVFYPDGTKRLTTTGNFKISS